MLIAILLSNILSFIVLYFSIKYIKNTCNYTYTQLLENPIKTVTKIEIPFLFKCIEYEEGTGYDYLLNISKNNSYYEIQEGS